MKGDKFMKAVVIILLCVVASYLIFSVTRFSGDSFTTYKAVRYEVGDGITTSGFLVRSEELLSTGKSGIIVPTRSEGEKVGKGQTVAAVYQDETAKSRQRRIEALEQELDQMKYAYNYSSSDLDSATLDSDILRLMNQITVSASRREYAAADQSAEDLKPYILRRYLNSCSRSGSTTPRNSSTGSALRPEPRPAASAPPSPAGSPPWPTATRRS